MQTLTLRNGVPLFTATGRRAEAVEVLRDEFSPDWKG